MILYPLVYSLVGNSLQAATFSGSDMGKTRGVWEEGEDGGGKEKEKTHREKRNGMETTTLGLSSMNTVQCGTRKKIKTSATSSDNNQQIDKKIHLLNPSTLGKPTDAGLLISFCSYYTAAETYS